MKPEDLQRQIQYLATTLASIGGYYAIRACSLLPNYRLMIEGMDIDLSHPGLGRAMLGFPYLTIGVAVGVLLVTLFAIWRSFKHHQIVSSVGIVMLFVIADRALTAGVAPIVQAISVMGNQ